MQLTFGVVLLAAGASTRMGRPKLLLPWGDTSVIGHLISQWEALAAEQIAVVCAAGDTAMQAELDRVVFSARDRIINDNRQRGMFSSVQCAARWQGWAEGLTHWAIVLGDQPHLRHETLQALLDSSASHPEGISVPKYDGHRCHPVVLPRQEFLRLATSRATDLKSILDDPVASVHVFESNDPALGMDIDWPDDYQKAIRVFQAKE